MSVDFVARALAKQQAQSGQAQFTTLATAIPGVQVPAGVRVIQTSGYASEGIGAGTYVNDPLATAALAAAHPRFCKADAGGRYWRLLPDENGLIPVVCGGAAGMQAVPFVYDTLAQLADVSNGGLVHDANIALSSSGGDILMTSTSTNNTFVWRDEAPGVWKMSAVVKAGTAPYVLIASTHIDSSQRWANFDLNAGTVTFDTYGNATITSLGGGYYRIEAVDNMTTWAIGIGTTNNDSRGSAVGITAYFKRIEISKNLGVDWLDDRPAIQDAISYGEAAGAQGTRYDAPNYALWRTSRNTALGSSWSNKTGFLLRTTKSHKFVSTCSGTTLRRRDTDGSPMGIAKFDNLDGTNYWRGGGILVEGQSIDPQDVSDNSVFLHDIMLDGGISDSSEQNNPYGAYFNIADGDGWDVTDKGIWQQNDHFCGHIVLEGRSGVRCFMGELIYSSSGGTASVADREIRIGPEVELGQTCGSCLNANGHTLRVERCSLHNAFMGLEGWTGHLGGYIKAVITDCNRNTLQGGIPNYGAGSFFLPTRPIPTEMPMGHVDLMMQNAGAFEIGSWISGRIESFDCYPNLGNRGAFAGGSHDIDLECITWADQQNVLAGVGIIGGAEGDLGTDRIQVRVTTKRTDHATTSNYRVLNPVYGYGSYGPDVVVRLDEGSFQPAGVVFNNAIKVLGFNGGDGSNGAYFDIEANNNGTIDLLNTGNAVRFTCTNGGASYYANLPVTGIPTGYRLFLRNFTLNYAGGVACRIPASNFSANFDPGFCRDLIIPYVYYPWTELEFNGNHWVVITPPPPLVISSSYDPPSVAAGASVTTTIAAYGAVVGDLVEISFSNSLQGMILSAHVSAANTVTAVLFNPGGSAVDLASGTLRMILR